MMLRKKIWLSATLICIVVVVSSWMGNVMAQSPFFNHQYLSTKEQLGKSIFFDEQLSIKQPQACAVCHDPKVGWTGAQQDINKLGSVYEGSIKDRFGNRKPPSSAYATLSPGFHFSEENGQRVFIGGNFWDGRATGKKLGSPAADQAQGPFLNPLEQGLPDNACVVYKVCTSRSYPVAFTDVWGYDACQIDWPSNVRKVCKQEGVTVQLSAADRSKVNQAYDNIALSIAAFEGSAESNAFTSKYDYYTARKVDLTSEEKRGLNLFRNKARCFQCHTLDRGTKGEPAVFTDFTYDNIGVPRNPDNPWYNSPFNSLGKEWVDLGLGGFLASRPDYQTFAESNKGKQKVPTLRNVAKRPHPNFAKAYMHNGYFKTLKQVVHFYNTRDLKPTCADPFTRVEDAIANKCWPAPEVTDNVNKTELGNLLLSHQEEEDLVAFLKTLDDGYKLKNH
ncbi:cytochrome c551 peroxidase [Nostoc carneum NIES-2107]|nr:cytochrome c551 peroxidase [Nostoc carneum NIES-2107]